MASSKSFNERDVIRREIQAITTRLLRQTTSGRIKRSMIIKHCISMENFLYKRAPCMEYYSDLSTLEARLMKAAGAIFAYRNSRDMRERVGQQQEEARRLAAVQMERRPSV